MHEVKLFAPISRWIEMNLVMTFEFSEVHSMQSSMMDGWMVPVIFVFAYCLPPSAGLLPNYVKEAVLPGSQANT